MKVLFRGFYRNEKGKETIYLNGEAVKGDWVYWDEYGSLTKTYYWAEFRSTDYVYVLDNRNMIIPETVSEAVRGLKDKNRCQVFEGDIVKVGGKDSLIGIIVYDEEEFAYAVNWDAPDACWQAIEYFGLEVIGTKWDKPKIQSEAESGVQGDHPPVSKDERVSQ